MVGRGQRQVWLASGDNGWQKRTALCYYGKPISIKGGQRKKLATSQKQKTFLAQNFSQSPGTDFVYTYEGDG